MRIAIAGGHGQIALQLSRLLAADHEVAGIIRNPDHAADLHEAGAEPLELDLEEATTEDLAKRLAGVDAVVFAAGAGPGSGAARKEAVDYGAAVLLRDAAVVAGVTDYVMVSAMGTDDPPPDDDVFSVYLRAKARADRAVMDSELDWTIVRPGRLTDDEPTGRVAVARHVDRGAIPRADVAAVLAAVLVRKDTRGHVFEVVGGDQPIDAALDTLVGSS